MDNATDSLQIKIEKAKTQLPEITRRAIDAVPWQTVILEMRTSKGYTFEQLGDLEIETELLLCGLLHTEEYPKELEKRMGITKAQADVLVNDMNELVFKKIREKMIASTEQKQESKEITTPQTTKPQIPTMIMPQKEAGIHPILAQKLSGSFQVGATSTEHTLENLSKTKELPSGTSTTEIPKPSAPASYPPSKDPYRLSPEE